MKLNIYGSGTRYWLVTPEFTASQDLTFDLALTDYYNANPIEDDTAQDDDRFVVLVYADEAWHILREWNNSGSTYVYNDISNTGENVSIALTDYYGMDVKIAFYGESTVSNNGDNDLHIDNVISGIPTPAGEWQTVTIEDNTCTLTGLLPMTDYEVKVEGACEGEQGHVTEMVSFTTDVACIAPSGLAAAKVGPESFELSWTENGETTAWQIQVNEEEPIDVTENPYTVTGLEPETEYSVKVRANGGDDGYSEWTYSITVTTLVTNPVPFDLAVSDITPTTATVSWTGFSDSYNVYLGTDDITNLFSADFDNQAIPADWITEDTYPWTVVVYDGGYCIQSSNAGESSSTSSISVTKTYSMDGTIEFDAQCMGEGTSSAYDKCVFSIDGVAQFANGKNGEQWDHYTFDVTEGEHTFTWSYSKDSSVNPDGDYFAVDNVVMNGVNTVWNEPIAVTDTEYTFDELTHGTTYRVKVEAVNGEDISEASEVVRFTTLETVSITFAKEGYSTYYNSQRVVVLPAGMKARIVTAQDNNKLTYETIADGDGDTKTVVPATAMMLQVAPTDVSQVIDITLTKAPAMYTQRTDNLLHGSDVATTTTGNADDARFYKLSYNKSGTDIGWYWGTADGSPFTSAAHKAWLALPEAAAGARNFLSLPDFSDSQANTSIDDMPTAVDNVDGTWYSIDGVKLDGQPTRKGLYIVNGQKKVVK